MLHKVDHGYSYSLYPFFVSIFRLIYLFDLSVCRGPDPLQDGGGVLEVVCVLDGDAVDDVVDERHGVDVDAEEGEELLVPRVDHEGVVDQLADVAVLPDSVHQRARLLDPLRVGYEHKVSVIIIEDMSNHSFMLFCACFFV